jgi:uncharacterized protein
MENFNKVELPLKAYTKENRFKLLPHDVGLMGAAIDIPIQMVANHNSGLFKGYIAEVVVSQQLIGQGAKELFSWKEGESEIEFLIEHDGNIIPLEVKSVIRTQAKSLRVYKEKYNPRLAIKLSSKNLRLEKNHLNAPVYMATLLNELISSSIQ